MTSSQQHQRFTALLHEHRKIIFKVAASYGRSSADRDDLAQEIAAQLWRSFGRYDAARAKFSTWMYRIALNVAISQARRRPEAGRFEPLDAHHLETVGGDEPLDEIDERLTALHAFIARLDPLNRALILLYLEDRSHAEMAAILGITRTNVATKIARIKQQLRGQMVAAETTGA